MLRQGYVEPDEQFMLVEDVEFAVWSVDRVRTVRTVPAGIYKCTAVHRTITDEIIIFISSPKLEFGPLIFDALWKKNRIWLRSPGRKSMTQIPYVVGDKVVEIKTGRKHVIDGVFLHKDHVEHHYHFEGSEANRNLRWHHELKKEEAT